MRVLTSVGRLSVLPALVAVYVVAALAGGSTALVWAGATPTPFVTPSPFATPANNHFNSVHIELENVLLSHELTGENVEVNGTLVVKTLVAGRQRPMKVKNSFKLDDDVVAIGQTSGAAYKVSGKGTTTVRVRNATVSQLDHVAVLTVRPADARSATDRAQQFDVHYSITYGPNGEAVSSSLTALPPLEPGACRTVVQYCN